MNFWNNITVGFKEIGAHKFRSLLTMLGIILGVASLVAMSALVNGMETGMKQALIAFGGLEKIRIEQQEDLPLSQRHLADQAVGITMNDVQALRQGAPLVHTITPSLEHSGFRRGTTLTYQGKSARPWMFAGTWPSALELNEHVIAHGRMFNEIDDEQARSVCVIGTGIRDELFGDPEVVGREINPVGQTILISQQPFRIIGMFEHYESEEARKERLARLEAIRSGELVPQPEERRRRGGHFVYRMKNNTVYIPLNTMLIKLRGATETDLEGRSEAATTETTATELGGTPRLSTLYMKIRHIDLLEPALQQVRNIMMITHKGIEDWYFRTDEDWADEITVAIRNARVSGSIIAAICLIVGGIGITNIMLASISERVREIGIRKAVGATTQDLFLQILIESVVLALLGALAGLAVSFGLVQILSQFTPTDNAPIITVGAMAFAFACSAAVGILAGLFPAIKASRLHPIQALRYE